MKSAQIEKILNRLENVRKINWGWMASCPVPNHGKGRGDVNPSLSIRQTHDGIIFINCFASCSKEAILTALGLRWGDLFPDNDRRRGGVL
jgi:hypothetical protein